jgi:hypothetical protein
MHPKAFPQHVTFLFDHDLSRACEKELEQSSYKNLKDLSPRQRSEVITRAIMTIYPDIFVSIVEHETDYTEQGR